MLVKSHFFLASLVLVRIFPSEEIGSLPVPPPRWRYFIPPNSLIHKLTITVHWKSIAPTVSHPKLHYPTEKMKKSVSFTCSLSINWRRNLISRLSHVRKLHRPLILITGFLFISSRLPNREKLGVSVEMNEFLSKIGKGLLSSPSFTTTYEKERFLQLPNTTLLTFFSLFFYPNRPKGILFSTQRSI